VLIRESITAATRGWVTLPSRVLFGMTGAGKSVIIADLLAQIGHRFGFRLIIEEGLSHAVLTQTQGCEPIIVNPNEFFVLRKQG
jgi:DNA repair ATPase RecN